MEALQLGSKLSVRSECKEETCPFPFTFFMLKYRKAGREKGGAKEKKEWKEGGRGFAEMKVRLSFVPRKRGWMDE